MVVGPVSRQRAEPGHEPLGAVGLHRIVDPVDGLAEPAGGRFGGRPVPMTLESAGGGPAGKVAGGAPGSLVGSG
ncbi:hypothetical protein [Streptosporangium sp. NPDC049644]|uniref:hypothetical protein n=1 Tax=Streptosporangium sp. NPDC049644 TaxID=3155507 RepID=UPI0034370845